MGLLINIYIKAYVTQKRTMEILNYKHNLSLELTKLDNWDMLISELVKLPNSIAPIRASRLYVYNPVSGKMEDVAKWNLEGAEKNMFYYDGQKCMEEHANIESLFIPCCSSGLATKDETKSSKEYCLPITYANSLIALIQFKLKAAKYLSDEQTEIFDSIRPEIALALKAAWEQKKLSEIRIAETALAERHSLSTYLHDNLSQNLAYVCLKLDQLTAENEGVSISQLRRDLQSMKDSAQDSYEIVRGMLETIHPKTTPRIINLLREQANKVSKRAHFEIPIEEKGKESAIPLEIQRTVFYVFKEVLNNVEKHAKAKKVDVLVDWREDNLLMTISDDGIGFDPQTLNGNKHFGLDIIRERVDKVNGRVDIQSSVNSGTTIAIRVPIILTQKEKH